jgi:uncharacterized coiled-coil protein SlyX
VSINRVAGYFKTKVDDIKVIEKLNQLEKRINDLQERLAEPLEQIRHRNEKIAQLIASGSKAQEKMYN